MKWMALVITFIFIIKVALSETLNIDQYSQKMKFWGAPFTDAKSIEKLIIPDPIMEKSPNTKIFYLPKIGFIREVTTNTGCNEGCLPLEFTLEFDANGKFMKIVTRETLTKKNHIPFTPEETHALTLFLFAPENQNRKVPSPYEVVDATTMATTKEYSSGVAKEAALSFYRILNYKQETEKEIASLLTDPRKLTK